MASHIERRKILATRRRSTGRQEADRRGARGQVTPHPIANDRRARPAGRRVHGPEGAYMDVFIRGVTLISQICGVFAAGLIAASVVIVCEMVTRDIQALARSGFVPAAAKKNIANSQIF
jgi:hypothetical protein